LYWFADPRAPGGASERQRFDTRLRAVLARLRGCPPDALAIERETDGRPFLDPPGVPDFSLSHTPGGTVLAVCAIGRIGVDLERLDRPLAAHRLARRWFAPEEADALEAMPAPQAIGAFLRLWTAKEAACKATGTGIGGHSRHWVFDAGPEQPRLLSSPADAGRPERWRFFRAFPSSGHTIAVAWRDAPEAVRITAYAWGG